MNTDQKPTIKSLVDSPLKKMAIGLFVATTIGQIAVPAGVAAYGGNVGWSAAEIAAKTAISFGVNEALLIGSVLVLGKPLVSLLRTKIKETFSRSKSVETKK